MKEHFPTPFQVQNCAQQQQDQAHLSWAELSVPWQVYHTAESGTGATGTHASSVQAESHHVIYVSVAQAASPTQNLQ